MAHSQAQIDQAIWSHEGWLTGHNRQLESLEKKVKWLTVAMTFFVAFTAVIVLSIAVDFRSSLSIASGFFVAIAAAAVTAVVLFRKEK